MSENKKKLLSFLLFILCIILLVGFILLIKFYLYNKRIENAKVEVILKDNLNLEFLDKKRVSDFIETINGKIINDYEIDSTKLGEKVVKFKFINDDGITLSYKYNINVIDSLSPVIWLNDNYNIYLGDNSNLTDKILCGDNYDSTPNCFIEGTYDYNKVGKYTLVFKAIDNSNNQTTKKFVLNVVNKTKSSSTSVKRTLFSDIIKKHKNDKTRIGIDVSKWQGNIDFEKVKEAGCEFVMIKVGSSKKDDDNYTLDPKFKKNIESALENGLNVGIYFYSSASSIKEAKKEALWVLEQIKDYKITMPIAFDWENFNYFNNYLLSFFELTNIANAFLDTVKKEGYETLLYGSKNYLEKIWLDTTHDTWLAHYTDKTNYDGSYSLWQLCDNGKIDGINGNVDIDVMYLK